MCGSSHSLYRKVDGHPEGFLFHPGHTWVRPVGMDLAFVGATEFAVDFAGDLAAVSLPLEYHRIRAGEAAWTLVSRRGRRLVQVSPLAGRILVVNADLKDDVGRLVQSPYQSGWIFCIKAPALPDCRESLLPAPPHRIWWDRTRTILGSATGTSVEIPTEEGAWRLSFGDDLEDQDWESLKRILFPASHRHGSPAGSRN